MRKPSRLVVLCLLAVFTAEARQEQSLCGTYRGITHDVVNRHRMSVRARRTTGGSVRRGAGQTAVAGGVAFAPRADQGDIAIIEASDGVLFELNPFDDMQGKLLTFTPTGAAAHEYRYSLAGYEGVGTGGTLLSLGDDDAVQQQIGFSFQFFGQRYDRVYINSDGNLTFNASDTASSPRSLTRLGSAPRISGLFADLDPTGARPGGGVTYESSATRFVATWRFIPEWENRLRIHTFQIRLYPDGKIELGWESANPTSALVGIAPGTAPAAPTLVSFDQPSGAYTNTVAERFGTEQGLDVVTIGQRFYATHDDAYDYLVIFNGLEQAIQGAVAVTNVTRNRFTGNGDVQLDYSRDFGSPNRLQAVIDMGDPTKYPDDLTAGLGERFGRPADSSIDVLAHEAAHLWLAYASVSDPGPVRYPMLWDDLGHWRFTFNSEASLEEGNAIEDAGQGASPRFRAVRASEQFAPLDLYLMGLMAPWDVDSLHPMFYVANSGIPPRSFNILNPLPYIFPSGERRDVKIAELIASVGRRTPDYTVSQKQFRFAFIYIIPPGQQTSDQERLAEFTKVQNFRSMFPDHFRSMTGLRASADTSFKRSMQLSVFPAAGVVRGSTANATITLETAPDSPLTVSLASSGGAAVPGTVTFAAGAISASFTIRGDRAGVDQLIATPSSTLYETVSSNIQVLDSAAGLRVAVVSGGDQMAQGGVALREPVVLRVVDENNLPYPGIRVQATVSAGGTLAQASAVSDETGTVRFNWTPGLNAFNELRAKADGGGPETLVYAWSRPSFQDAGLVNAASFQPDVAVGSLASLFGVNLAPVQAWASRLPLPTTMAATEIVINGTPAPLLYVSPLQINFQVPAGIAAGTWNVIVDNIFGVSAAIPVTVSAVAPAIFDDPAAGVGAIHLAGQRAKTNQVPAQRNEFIEIYATGLGQVNPTTLRTAEPVQVLIDGVPAAVDYAGLSGFVGLYQVNARVPAGTASGRRPVVLEIAGKRSPEVYIQVQ